MMSKNILVVGFQVICNRIALLFLVVGKQVKARCWYFLKVVLNLKRLRTTELVSLEFKSQKGLIRLPFLPKQINWISMWVVH